MRATATGLFSSTGRIGGIYALVVLGLKRHWSGLPFVLFGAPSVAAALLALLFPGMFRTTLLSVTNVKFGPATRQAHDKNYKDIRQVSPINEFQIMSLLLWIKAYILFWFILVHIQ